MEEERASPVQLWFPKGKPTAGIFGAWVASFIGTRVPRLILLQCDFGQENSRLFLLHSQVMLTFVGREEIWINRTPFLALLKILLKRAKGVFRAKVKSFFGILKAEVGGWVSIFLQSFPRSFFFFLILFSFFLSLSFLFPFFKLTLVSEQLKQILMEDTNPPTLQQPSLLQLSFLPCGREFIRPLGLFWRITLKLV